MQTSSDVAYYTAYKYGSKFITLNYFYLYEKHADIS
jgi:hypothetical protein